MVPRKQTQTQMFLFLPWNRIKWSDHFRKNIVIISSTSASVILKYEMDPSANLSMGELQSEAPEAWPHEYMQDDEPLVELNPAQRFPSIPGT